MNDSTGPAFKASRLDHLDLLRGLAAYLVLAGHLRAYIFQSFAEIEKAGVHASALAKLFYFVTSLGHQAVVVFFALSGFLVGGKALQDILAGRFSWQQYILRRLTRLWIVIIPALIFTLAFDLIGVTLTHGIGYDGAYYDLYAEGPRRGEGLDHSLQTLLGNLLFLQTIFVPTFGTNAPMWSLANEFWYYVIFPIVPWVVLSSASATDKIAGLLLFCIVAALLPREILEGGSIWLAGAIAAWCARHDSFECFFRSLAVRAAAVLMLMGGLVAARMPTVGAGDLTLGLIVAAVLPVLAHLPVFGGRYSKCVRGLSEISYTLYLTHFPLLTLIVLAGMAPARWAPGYEAAGLFAALLCVATGWAAAVWWCFERHTDTVYAVLRRLAPA